MSSFYNWLGDRKPGPAFKHSPHDFDPFPGPTGVEASLIAPRLWQGSMPDTGQTLGAAGFDVLVLCASSYQPILEEFPGLYHVVNVGFHDTAYPKMQDYLYAHKGGAVAAKMWKEGRNVLITCRAGLNRSGLTMALALHYITGASGKACADRVQARRARSLCNRVFYSYLYSLPAYPPIYK